MRLTLRTMLAYLDDILEPDDAEDIGKKIEESEFATNLVHRLRDCMRRLRLGVPALMGRGLAHDPNSVAEYLDNTLSDERVPEFEKICLESDVHLAEVASCHQILTLVLGEPAEIEAEARQRMYQIPAQIDAPPVQADAVKTGSPVATPPPVQLSNRRAKPEVPEYLREKRSRLWPVAAVVLVSAMLSGGALLMFGPAEWRPRLTALADQDHAEAPQEADRAAAEKIAETESPVAEPKTPVADADIPDAVDSAQPAAPTENMPEGDGSAPAPEPDADARGNLKNAADVPSTPLPPEPDDTVPAPIVLDFTPGKSDPATALTKPELPEKDAPGDAAVPRAEAAAEGFGRYTSKREVLLKLDPASGEWKRLAAMSPLAKGDRLMSLPSFRPTISLSTSITIQADGAALLELLGWTDQGVPVIGVEFGRLLMLTVGKAGNSLQLKLDDQQPQLTFVDAESTLAVEVRRILPLGKNPELAAAPLAVEVYATSGPIRLRIRDASLDLQAPSSTSLVGGFAEPVEGDFPKWVTAEGLTDFERRATTSLEPLLAQDRPVALKLKELADDRRREVRSLAVRSACYLGDFEPCVLALNDAREKTLWSGTNAPYIEELRAAVARSPETAAQVRTTLERQRSADASTLYRMLWGYSVEDLKGGDDAKLVEGLNNESLDVRVLSFWNLQNTTGLASFGYHPEDLAAKRKAAFSSWKSQLRQGKVLPRNAATAKGKPPGGRPPEKVQP